MPVDFRSIGCCPPAEKADKVRPVCNALERPEAKLSRPWHRGFHPACPAVCSALLFHDAKGRTQCPDNTQIFTPFAIQKERILLAAAIHGQCKIGIAVIAKEVKALHETGIVKIIKDSVRRQERIPDQRPQNVTLHPAKPDGALRKEALLLQQQMRIIVPVHRRPPKGDLIPFRIPLAPDVPAHFLIQILERLILILHVFPERCMIRLRMKLRRFAVDLIVNLPAYDHGMVAKVLSQPGDNPGRELLILL